MKVELLCNSWRRVEKDEEGAKVKRRYRPGDVVDVTAAEARVLLRDAKGIKPMAKNVTAPPASSTSNK